MKILIISIIALSFWTISLQAQTKDTVYIATKDTVYLSSKEKINPINGEIGLYLGTPAGINLTGAIHADRLLVRLSGMSLSTISGIQVDVGYKFSEKLKTYHALTVGVGTFKIASTQTDSYNSSSVNWWDYVSLNYMLNTKGFLLGVGLSVGDGTFTNPQLMFQIGYSYQIR